MKHCFFIFAFILVLCGVSRAQEMKDRGFKAWSEGPLTEEDFSSRNHPDRDGNRSYIECSWRFYNTRKYIDGVRVLTWDAEAVMDRLSSWAVQESVDYWMLRHNQNIFDYYQLVGKQMAREMTRYFYPKEVYSYYKRRAEMVVRQYNENSAMGSDDEAVARFQENTTAALGEFESLPDTLPSFHKRFGISLFCGYTYELYSPGISDYFSKTTGANFGWELYYGRNLFSILTMNGGSAGRLKSAGISSDGFDWQKGMKVSTLNANISLGYRILNLPHIAISPFAGIGVSLFSQDIPEELATNKSSSDISSFAYMAGLQVDWFMLRRLDIRGPREYDEFPLTLRAYASRLDLPDIGPGWSFNIGLSVAGRAWFIRQNRVL